MVIERSHKKARPTRRRSSDLRAGETAGEPSGQRDARGRFSAGNRAAAGAGGVAATKLLVGVDAADEDARAVKKHAEKLNAAILRDMSDQGGTVRTLVGMAAREAAVSAYLGAEAARVGMRTPEGKDLLERATTHATRSERMLVTALDAGRVVAAAKPKAPPAWMTTPFDTEDEDAPGEDAEPIPPTRTTETES